MMYSISGKIYGLSDAVILIEDASGVCWELEASSTSIGSLRTASAPSADSETDSGTDTSSVQRVYTVLHHKEDSMKLFGFYSLEEKQAFLLLNKVNGIGPSQALKILSNASVAALVSAISAEDEIFLTQIPGIGLKGAKKIILSLKESMSAFSVHADTEMQDKKAGARNREQNEPQLDQLTEALCSMGYERKAAAQALRSVLQEEGEALPSEGEILRKAIIQLS